jgi:hypothetical protein
MSLGSGIGRLFGRRERRARILATELGRYGRKVHSQNDEDGVLEYLFQMYPPRRRYFVEFGIGPTHRDTVYAGGLEGNCVLLKKQGWDGLLLDGGVHPAEYGVKREFVTALNINALFEKHGVPDDLDLVSIDVDGQDIWIWLALQARPQVVVIEYNGGIPYGESKAVPFDTGFQWDGSDFMGASFSAVVKIGAAKGYVPVYANGVNLIFVAKELVANAAAFKPEALYRYASYHHTDPYKRRYTAI